MTITRFIGIDPGINHPALAVIDHSGEIVRTAKHNSKPQHSISEKLHYARDWFAGEFSAMATANLNTAEYQVVIELPEHQNSVRGAKCIDRNDFVKLCMSAGMLTVLFKSFTSVKEVALLTPSQWKGQVPKSITKKRMIEIYGLDRIDFRSDDEIDALALARFHLEHYAH